MEVGRELDALVAEKVMGWKYSQVSPNTERFFCREYGQQSGWWLRPEMDTEDGWACAKCSDVPPSYSTDIGAAWEVVEKKGGCHLHWLADRQYWNCQFWGKPTFGGVGTATTAPHAICEAALKAVEDHLSVLDVPDSDKIVTHKTPGYEIEK